MSVLNGMERPLAHVSVHCDDRWEHLSAGKHCIGEPESGKLCAVFARVSTGDQLKEGGSLSQQIDTAIKQAQRDGRPVSVLYVDPAKSATRLSFDQRGGVRVLLDDIRKGMIGTIYVYKRDRVARVSGEWLHFLKTCIKYGVEIVFTCAHEPPIGQGIYGKFQEALMSLWSELEAELISIRVRDSIVARFQNGEWIGGRPPYGLTRDPSGEITLHPDEAPVVREIFRLAMEERLGATRIARRLNESLPCSRRGFGWTRQAVLKVLSNRTYCGYLSLSILGDTESCENTVRLEERFDHLPVLISESVWEHLRERRIEKRRIPGAAPSRHYESPNLLAGLVRCGECGRLLSSRHFVRKHKAKGGETAVYHFRNYYCQNGLVADGCHAKRNIDKSAVEDAVLKACYHRLQSADIIDVHQAIQELWAERVAESEASRMAARLQLAYAESAVQRNLVAMERTSDEDQVRFYQARLAELLEARGMWAHRLQQVDGAYEAETAAGFEAEMPTWEEFRELFYYVPEEQRRAFLVDAVQEVTIDCHKDSVRVVFV
ncbi:MAG TPA: recombinase family protein [Symbiobacteriaceae bacterium]|nr:recombinase family protein [Symbiobacteriaceae bacterium]